MAFKFLVSIIFIETYAVVNGQYVPCQSWISFSVDDSNSLNPSDFTTQLNFVSSAIGDLNHPERIRVGGAFNNAFDWNNGLSIIQQQTSVKSSTQSPSQTYNLGAQFASIINDVNNVKGINIPMAALIFISDTSYAALVGADRFFPQLAGVEITFVLLGSSVDSTKLTTFSYNFITWIDFTQSQPENWNNITSTAAYGCNNIVTNSPSLSTGIPYYPCQSWISFNIDDSTKLNPNDFMRQLNFISSTIGSLNYFERVQAVGAYYEPVQWNSGLSLQQIRAAIELTQQGGLFRLRNTLATLLSTLGGIQVANLPIGSLIFISDTSDDALVGADQFFNILSNVRITFVLLGSDVDASKLTKFSNNFIYWPDLSQPEPLYWNANAGPAYGCINVGTLKSATATPSQPSTIDPYVKCQNWISFSYDVSNTLPPTDFKTQMNLISSTIGNLKYPNNVRVGGAFTETASWNSGLTISHMQAIISVTNETIYSYSLLQEFETLLTDVTSLETTDQQIGALIFISDTSDRALANANRLFSGLGNVQLTFVFAWIKC